MRILLIEDELKAIESLKKGFQEHDIMVDVANEGMLGFNLAKMKKYDVIVSDVIMPGMDGFHVVKNLRASGINTPVILLTALGGTDNTIEGLNLGADDYMQKPFEFNELLARVRALSRRGVRSVEIPSTLVFGDIKMDMDTKEVFRQDTKIDLTPKEFALLAYFITNQGRVISKSEIAIKVWDIDFDTNTNVIEVYINYLRNKIDRPFDKKVIHTVFGSGYILKSE